MEKFPSFNEIVGGTPKQKEDLIQEAAEAVALEGKERFGKKKYEKYIVEPTPEQQEAIDQAVSYANEVARRYGGREIDNQNIFLVKRGAVSKLSRNLFGGFYDAFNQSIVIEEGDTIEISLTAAHELLHKASFHSAKIDEHGEDDLYRSGISMLSQKRGIMAFEHANEAIITILTDEFFRKVLLNHKDYKWMIDRDSKIKTILLDLIRRTLQDKSKEEQLVTYIQTVRHFPDNSDILSVLEHPTESDMYKLGAFDGYYREEQQADELHIERAAEVALFESVLDRLTTQAEGNLGSITNLFDDFAQAHFSGRYLPLARKIDRVLGKGTFNRTALALSTDLKND